MAKKYQKSVFFHRQNSQKSEKSPAKTAKNCRKIRSKTFLKGGADLAGAILKGRAAGSSGPPIFRGGWAVAAVIGAALSSLKVVAGCCRFAAGGWCMAGGWCRAGRRCRAGSVAAGRWLSILYGVGCHWWRWTALSILYSSKVGRGVCHLAGRSRCSRAAGLSCCKAGCMVIGAAPISHGTPSPGRLSILYGSKVAAGRRSSGRPEQVQQGGGAVVLQSGLHGHRGRADLPGLPGYFPTFPRVALLPSVRRIHAGHRWRLHSSSRRRSSATGAAGAVPDHPAGAECTKGRAGRVACPAFCACPIWFYSLSPGSSAAGGVNPSRAMRSRVAVKI